MNHTTIRLAIIIIAAILMVTGTIFYPMVPKQQAYSATSATHQVKSEEEAAVRSSLQQRGQQHMNQENQCVRTGKCNNSNVGEQTLGNDNSITGFADQSNNVQAVVTPTPTPTLTLQNSGVLGIFKVCFPSCSGVTFTITVTGNNPQPSSFTLTGGGHQGVTLGPGTFTVTEAHVAGFNPPSFANDCHQTATGSNSATGTIRAGQILSCVITNISR